MKSYPKRGSWSLFLSLAIMTSVSLIGCGGGGGGGSTTGTTTTTAGTGSALLLADKISVVDAKSTTAAAPLKIGKFKAVPSTVTAAGTDWTNDKTQVYVHERSAESFDAVNEIICMMAQSKYDKMVNKGIYKAQIDNNLCKSNKDSASSAGQSSQNQSSGSTAPNYETWILDSKRADSNPGTPQYVKVWVHEKAEHDMPARVIYANVTITAGVDTKPPYGLFSLYFKGYPEGAVSGTPLFQGVLKAVEENGKVVLKFAEDDGARGSRQAALDKATDGSGKGSATSTDNFNGTLTTKSFNFAYDANYFLRTDGGAVCLDRNAYNRTAWSYGVYDSAGKRVSRNSGFPIKYNDGTKDNFGWVGYWGLWMPDTVTIADGATVKKQDYSNSGVTEASYTIVKKGGKLKKHTQKLLTLADVKYIPLDYWDNNTMNNFRVVWDGTVFNKTAQMTQSANGGTWTDLNPVQPLNLTTLQWGELNFWSQSLGGQARVKLDACTQNAGVIPTFSCSATGATKVVFYAEDIIYPGDLGTTVVNLSCYDWNCPNPAAFSTLTSTTNGNPFFVSTTPNTAYRYTFDPNAAGMVLKYNGTAVVLTGTITTTQYQWGVMSNALFDPAKVDAASGKTYLQLLACDWNTSQTCSWKAMGSLPEFYTWETGPSDWNQLTVLKDASGAVVKFESPLELAYTYPATATGVNSNATDRRYSGVKFNFEYSGFGNLQGIPGKCVDDSGVNAPCGPNVRWVPEFIIGSGGEVTPDNGTTIYYVKPLQVEESMQQTASCGTLTTTPYTLPTIAADFVDFTPSTEPTGTQLISTAPAVIGGVVQTGF